MRVFFNGVRRIIRQRRPSTPQAGALVARRREDEQLEVLLVSSKNNPDRWGLPKGHIEKGETAEECALRELLEEAGVDGEIVAYVGAVEYATGSRRLRVDYFLARALSEAEPEKGRRARWCDLRTATRLLSNPTTRTLLERAWPEIRTAL